MKGYIRPRSKGKWEITIDIGRDPSTNKRLRHFETVVGGKKEAQQRLAELLLNIKKGTYVKQPKELTVAAWLGQWLDSYVASSLSPKTRESYELELKYLTLSLIWEEYVLPSYGLIMFRITLPKHCRKAADIGLEASVVAPCTTTIVS